MLHFEKSNQRNKDVIIFFKAKVKVKFFFFSSSAQEKFKITYFLNLGICFSGSQNTEEGAENITAYLCNPIVQNAIKGQNQFWQS